MWLLDANMDVHLLESLKAFGMKCDSAANRGWTALSNGELVSAAVDAGFTCLLTRDQLFGESAGRALKAFPAFAVVVVNLPQKKSNVHQQEFVSAWNAGPIAPVPGMLTRWPD